MSERFCFAASLLVLPRLLLLASAGLEALTGPEKVLVSGSDAEGRIPEPERRRIESDALFTSLRTRFICVIDLDLDVAAFALLALASSALDKTPCRVVLLADVFFLSP